MPDWDRRQFMGLLIAAGVLPRQSLAMGDSTLVDIAELDVGRGTVSRPGAWELLLYDLEQTTSVSTRPGSVRVKPEQPELFEHPFLVLAGDGGFEPLSETAVGQLSEYLAYGGFLVMDDKSGLLDSEFDRSARRLARRLFPTRPMAPLQQDHSIYRSFFLLESVAGRVSSTKMLEGVTVGNLCPLVYSQNDLSGALDRGPDGRYRFACVPGGERQRKGALKVWVNLLMYALTANYKNDQAHIRQLMLERRLPR